MTLSVHLQEILGYIEEREDLLEDWEKNYLINRLIEKDPDFVDRYERVMDSVTTAIPEMKNLRPNSAISRNTKIITHLDWEVRQKMAELEKNFSPLTAEGEWLDIWGGMVGLTRKENVKATGKVLLGGAVPPDSTYAVSKLLLVGTKGSADEEAIRFRAVTTPSINPSATPDSEGLYLVETDIEAEEGGEKGNLKAGMITEVYSEVPYFNVVKQIDSTNGGEDRENDETYRVRVLEKFQKIGSVGPGWFIEKAKSFEGVKDAQVLPVIHGSGTVGVIISGTGTVVPQTLVDEIQAYFDSDEVKPLVNWTAVVYPAELETVIFVVDIDYLAGTNPPDETELTSKLNEYFNTLGIGEELVTLDASTYMKQVKNVYTLEVQEPIDPIVKPTSINKKLVLGSASFNPIEVLNA